MTAANPQKSYTQIGLHINTYHDLVQNQAGFTHAELRCALIAVRRGAHTHPVQISDSNWEDWTGLDARSKERALKGLMKKGFDVQGRGNRTMVALNRERWQDWSSHWSRQANPERPRTEGRPVDPPKVHPDCEHGCALLKNGPKLVNAPTATPNATRVSQTSTGEGRGVGGTETGTNDGRGGLSIVPAIKNATRVSRIGIETAWAMTLAALQALMPSIGGSFLFLLISTIAGMFEGLTDSEVAEAVRFAGLKRDKHGKVIQASAGLFLWTVPGAIEAIRRRKAAEPEPSPGADRNLERTASVLRARGAPYARAADLVEAFKRRVNDPAPFDLIAACEEIELEILAASIGVLPDADCETPRTALRALGIEQWM